MNASADAPGFDLGLNFDLDLALVAGGMALIAALYVWMLRRQRPMLSVGHDGLQVDHRALPWSEIESVSYARGSLGVLLRIATKHGLLAFREDQLIQHADDVRRKLVEGAHLVRATDVTIPKGLVHDPGDIYEEWRRPLPGEFAAAAQGTVGPRHATPKSDADATKKKAAVGFAAVVALLAKFAKAALLGAKYILGFGKLGGMLPTALTMLISVWAYARLAGWTFAAAFVVLLLLHELGHAAVIKAKGLRTSPIVFVPFFGAAIMMKDQFRDASVEAETAWGGPALGTLAACVCFLAFLGTGQEFWLYLSYLGFLLNLFNLIPLTPFDGGRIVAAITTWLWVPGLALAGLLAWRLGNPIVILFVALGALRAWQDWKSRRKGLAGDYYDMPLRYRALMSAGYFGLCGFLGWMSYHAHTLLQAAQDAG